jgi:cell division inhibitor SepF
MSVWKKVSNYLGLGPDDAYDDYDLSVEQERPMVRGGRSYEAADTGMGAVGPTRLPQRPPDTGTVRALPVDPDSSGVSVRRPTGSAVRPVAAPAQVRPHTVRPRRFDQAQEVADKFKEGQPVIVNLEGVDRDLSRRLIDFASGLCYGLGGAMEKVGSGVYLLTPANVSVAPEDRRNGFDD